MKTQTRLPSTIAKTCPYCHARLDDGRILVTYVNGELKGVSQTKRIGESFYTWVHTADGCDVPSLRRIATPEMAQAAGIAARAMN